VEQSIARAKAGAGSGSVAPLSKGPSVAADGRLGTLQLWWRSTVGATEGPFNGNRWQGGANDEAGCQPTRKWLARVSNAPGGCWRRTVINLRCATRRWLVRTASLFVATSILVGCVSGMVNLTVVNSCDHPVRIQTYDGHLDPQGKWMADPAPLADFDVPAHSAREQTDAFRFTKPPVEIRIVEPTNRSFLIDPNKELDAVGRWTIPLPDCASSDK
jgi:hypothetical protein